MRAALTRRGWRPRIASALLPLGLLTLCAAFAKASLIDTSVELEAVVESEEPATPPASLMIGPGGRDIRLVGELREGDAHRLAVVLEAHPDIERIHLTSEGGLADEGQALGDVIAAHRLITFVPDYCVSACTLAFVRGRQRLMLQDARIGFHAPYEQGLFGAVYRGDAGDQRAAYLAAGISSRFVAAALQVDPASIWFPARSELLAAHVVTASVDRYALPDSNLDDAPTLVGARASILQNFPILKGFLDRAPRAVDAIAAWYLDAYRQGRSEGEDVDTLEAVVSGAVALTFAEADDAALLDFVRYLGRALLVAHEPTACAAIAGDMDLSEAARQLGKGEGDALALLARALNVRASAAPDATARSAFSSARSGPVRNCAEWRQVYADVLNRSHRESIAAIRSRLAEISSIDLTALGSKPGSELHASSRRVGGPTAAPIRGVSISSRN